MISANERKETAMVRDNEEKENIQEIPTRKRKAHAMTMSKLVPYNHLSNWYDMNDSGEDNVTC